MLRVFLELHQLLTQLTSSPVLTPILPGRAAAPTSSHPRSSSQGRNGLLTGCCAGLVWMTGGGIGSMERASQFRARKHCTVLLGQLTTAIYRITDTYRPARPIGSAPGILQHR